jgi:hypothetical protein
MLLDALVTWVQSSQITSAPSASTTMQRATANDIASAHHHRADLHALCSRPSNLLFKECCCFRVDANAGL